MRLLPRPSNNGPKTVLPTCKRLKPHQESRPDLDRQVACCASAHGCAARHLARRLARHVGEPRPSTASQQSGVVNRAEVIKRAEQLFVQGQWKKAAELMGKAAGFFVGDAEITALLVQYREKASQVDEVLARMATLAQQNRWCEVSQILAELQQTGVPITGLDQYAAAAQQNSEPCSRWSQRPERCCSKAVLPRLWSTRTARFNM